MALSLRDSKSFSKVRVWDTATGRDVWARDDWGTRGGFFSTDRLKYSRDGRTLVVASERAAWEQIYVLDAATGGDQRPPLLNIDGDLADLCLSEDGRRLFARTTQLKTSVVVWDLVTGRKLLTLPVNNVSVMTTDREGRRIFLVKDVPGTGKLELETFDGTPLADEK